MVNQSIRISIAPLKVSTQRCSRPRPSGKTQSLGAHRQAKEEPEGCSSLRNPFHVTGPKTVNADCCSVALRAKRSSQITVDGRAKMAATAKRRDRAPAGMRGLQASPLRGTSRPLLLCNTAMAQPSCTSVRLNEPLPRSYIVIAISGSFFKEYADYQPLRTSHAQ